jgi:NADPH-dependent 2,4-dienoyl-CoA reductase/sulfur reductase-like enzyme
VAAERGHEVIVYEAANDPGGQVRLTALSPRRAEMIGVTDWRFAECERLGVRFYFNSFADAEAVLAETPDVVIVATGGLPATDFVLGSEDLVVSAWDILSGDVAPGENVLIYDEAGDYAGIQAAEKLAKNGARVEIVMRDRNIAPEVMSMSLTPAIRNLQECDAVFTPTWRLEAVRKEGNALVAELGSDFGSARQEREVDQIVVNHGTRPMDDLYFDLKPMSVNLGEVDYAALIEGRPQAIERNPDGAFQLFRIGDAISSRNTHAAIYDALRLLKDI